MILVSEPVLHVEPYSISVPAITLGKRDLIRGVPWLMQHELPYQVTQATELQLYPIAG